MPTWSGFSRWRCVTGASVLSAVVDRRHLVEYRATVKPRNGVPVEVESCYGDGAGNTARFFGFLSVRSRGVGARMGRPCLGGIGGVRSRGTGIPVVASAALGGAGTSTVPAVAVSYTHLTLPTKRIV